MNHRLTLDEENMVTVMLMQALLGAGVKDIPVRRVSLKDPGIRKKFRQRFNPIDGEGKLIAVVPAKERKEAIDLLKKEGKIK